MHYKIPFTDHNVVEEPAALEELVKTTGRRATPVIVVGFDRGKLERLLNI